MRAVIFNEYGSEDVLEVRDVADPPAEPGRLLVRVRTAGLNPGEIAIRIGALHDRWPATFPSGQGSDFAGVVEQVGGDAGGFSVGDEVLGWTDERAAQAELVSVPTHQLVARPLNVPWEVAGSLVIAGATAWAAVRAVAPREGETVVVSAAAGGVGCLAVQLVRRAGARVIGLASEDHHAWLTGKGVEPLSYGTGVEGELRSRAPKVDAFIDLFGGGYVDLAVALGVAPERIDTIIDYAAAEQHGTKTDGSAEGKDAETVRELVDLLAGHELELPISAIYPLDAVRDAYRDLAKRHTRGKRVLEL